MYNDLKENGRQINVNQKGKSLTGNTVRGIHTILHEMMEYALKENMIFNNPTNGTTIPKIEPFELQILTDKQIKKMILAYLSDINESRFKLGNFSSEETRLLEQAAEVMEKYADNFTDKK